MRTPHKFQVLEPGFKKERFNLQEDFVILQVVAELRLYCWDEVASRVPGRSKKQVRELYFDRLDPSLKRDDKNWTANEDILLKEAYKTFGRQLTKISKILYLVGKSASRIGCCHATIWSFFCFIL